MYMYTSILISFCINDRLKFAPIYGYQWFTEYSVLLGFPYLDHVAGCGNVRLFVLLFQQLFWPIHICMYTHIGANMYSCLQLYHNLKSWFQSWFKSGILERNTLWWIHTSRTTSNTWINSVSLAFRKQATIVYNSNLTHVDGLVVFIIIASWFHGIGSWCNGCCFLGCNENY